jgi:hypothetical protein
MLVIAWISAGVVDRAGKGLSDSRITNRSGYFANCDESQTENDYMKQISGGDFHKRLRQIPSEPGKRRKPFRNQQLRENVSGM